MVYKRKTQVYRRFNGKRYALHGEYWTKDSAENSKTHLKAKNYLVRIVHTAGTDRIGGSYKVFARKQR